jgi:Family of unknown function (DUF5939)
LFWGSWAELPENIEDARDRVMLDEIELPPGAKANLSLQLPPRFIIVFEPVSHAAQFINFRGEPTKERRTLSIIYNKLNMRHAMMEMQPGPFRLALENKTDRRLLAGVWVAADELHHLLGKRKPFLS